MATYIPPAPAVAEMVHRSERASLEQRRRLEPEPSHRLRHILTDPSEPTEARANALLLLMLRKDAALPALLPSLFDDPAVGQLAIRYCPASDPAAVQKLRALLDHPDDRVWPQAAVALARAKDDALRPRLLAWLWGDDAGRRNVATECLLTLDGPGAAEELVRRWEAGACEEEERLVLGAALLRLGDRRALPLLEATARRGRGAWAAFAADAVTGCDPVLGLRLMLWVLERGDLEAQRSVVSHGWNMAGLPHAFTADAIHETRAWLEHRLAEASAN